MPIKKIVNNTIIVLNLIVAFALLLCYLSPIISPETFWIFGFLGLAYPFLVLINLVFVFYWIASFNIKFIISFIAILIGINHVLHYVQLNAKKKDPSKKTLNIVTFNTHYMGAYDNKDSDTTLLFSILDKINPDIICFQEFANLNGNFERPMFRNFFKKYKNYHIINADPQSDNYPTGYGVCIISKYPVIKSGFLEKINQSANLSLFADIEFNDTIIRVVNTHLRSINFEPKDYKTIETFNKNNADVSVEKIRPMMQKLKYAFAKRAKQAEALRFQLDNTPYPLIVCGDFNDPPTSYAYTTVKGNLKDAFRQSGIGLSRTYIGKMPSFRIDYILHSPFYKSFNYKTNTLNFSDHKMVSATLEVN